LTDAPLRLWSGQTLHKRFTPFERSFRYRLVLIDIDIDRLDEAGRMSPWFKVNRMGLFSFHEKDHGEPGRAQPLRAWAEDLYRTAGIELARGAIRLVTFPRHFFYKFAPLSLWYGYDERGALKGIIYEVRNTFGERHCYVASAEGARPVHASDKAFHVSPFFDVSGQYRFTMRPPANTLDVVVENIKDGARAHLANIKARSMRASSSNLLLLALKNPLSTLGVTVGIHWQALLIWMRGARYHSKPAPPAGASTLALTLPASSHAIAPDHTV
jgi:uncharacterized protein